MKLDGGHLTAPVPWPIQSSPMAGARKPTTRNSLRIGFPSMRLARLARGNRRSRRQSGARDLLAQERGAASPIGAAMSRGQTSARRQEKAPDAAGAFA